MSAIRSAFANLKSYALWIEALCLYLCFPVLPHELGTQLYCSFLAHDAVFIFLFIIFQTNKRWCWQSLDKTISLPLMPDGGIKELKQNFDLCVYW